MRANWFEWRFATLDDRAACRTLIRHGSKSFHAASLLLPKDLRDPAYAIYAFCRIADDAVDEGTACKRATVRLRERLTKVYDGTPEDCPIDRALTDVVWCHDLPRPLFDALIEGLEWDQLGQRYHSIGELHAYAARVASAVGTIMTCLMRRRAPHTIARACDLGVAMQLTNIARDVGEDARNGRIYLPLDWMREAGIDPEAFLIEPKMTPELGQVIQRLLAHADTLYAKSKAGIADLPASCRPAINSARRIYQAIGREVAENGYDSVSQRAVVSGSRKAAIAMSSAMEACLLGSRDLSRGLHETQFLVDAVETHDPISLAHPLPDTNSRVEWVIALLHSLEDRKRHRGKLTA